MHRLPFTFVQALLSRCSLLIDGHGLGAVLSVQLKYQILCINVDNCCLPKLQSEFQSSDAYAFLLY